jgi:hypothetical protein
MRYNRLCLFHLFIPDYNNLGCVYSIPIPKKRNGEVRSEVLYLDPRLEKQDEKIIIAVIAHEIAHIFLKHTTKCYGEKSKAQEKEAWELIKKWGFERESKKYMAFRKNEVNHGKNKKRKKS